MTRHVIQSSDVTWQYDERVYPGFVLHVVAGTCGGLWSADYLVVREDETREDETREEAPEDALRVRVLSALRRKDDATRH